MTTDDRTLSRDGPDHPLVTAPNSTRSLAHQPSAGTRNGSDSRTSGYADAGATMVEYGFMVLLVATVCIALVAAIGTQVADFFNEVLGWF